MEQLKILRSMILDEKSCSINADNSGVLTSNYPQKSNLDSRTLIPTSTKPNYTSTFGISSNIQNFLIASSNSNYILPKSSKMESNLIENSSEDNFCSSAMTQEVDHGRNNRIVNIKSSKENKNVSSGKQGKTFLNTKDAPNSLLPYDKNRNKNALTELTNSFLYENLNELDKIIYDNAILRLCLPQWVKNNKVPNKEQTEYEILQKQKKMNESSNLSLQNDPNTSKTENKLSPLPSNASKKYDDGSRNNSDVARTQVSSSVFQLNPASPGGSYQNSPGQITEYDSGIGLNNIKNSTPRPQKANKISVKNFKSHSRGVSPNRINKNNLKHLNRSFENLLEDDNTRYSSNTLPKRNFNHISPLPSKANQVNRSISNIKARQNSSPQNNSFDTDNRQVSYNNQSSMPIIKPNMQLSTSFDNLNNLKCCNFELKMNQKPLFHSNGPLKTIGVGPTESIRILNTQNNVNEISNTSITETQTNSQINFVSNRASRLPGPSRNKSRFGFKGK